MDDRNQLLDQFSRGPELLKESLGRFPKEMWTWKPAPERWSIHQIIVHLADSEANAYTRCRKLIAENGTEITTYNQDVWAEELMYHDQGTDEAIALLTALRRSTTALLKLVPEHVWATHAIVHPEHGSYTLNDWLRIYASHVPNHIRQMEGVYEAWKEVR